MRNRRRFVRHLLGQQDAKALRPERQRPQPLQAHARHLPTKRADQHSRRRVAALVGPWLRRRLGRFARGSAVDSLADILAPAIEYGEQGFAVTEIIANGWRSSAKTLAQWPDTAATYLPGGRAPTEGELFHNPRLAASYRAIANEGPQAFYTGSIGQKIVSFSDAHGGYMSLKDLADHHSDWVEPVSTNYRGYDVWEVPPNTQGIAALQMLNLIEPYDVRKMGRGSCRLVSSIRRSQEAGLRGSRDVLCRSRLWQATGRPVDLEGIRQAPRR